jgi:hypothetical protein
MQAKFYYCLVILILFIVILLFLIGYLLNLTELQNFTDALNVAETTDGFCTPDNQLCVFHPSNIDPPISFTTDFTKSTALLLLDLIGRLEYTNDVPITSPNGFTLIQQLKSGSDSPVFCGMWMNNNDLYIVFRGTKTQAEWSLDLQTQQDPITQDTISLQVEWTRPNRNHIMRNEDQILVHSGFLELFQEFESAITTTIQVVNPSHLYISGHSLGSAVSQLCGFAYSDLNIPMVVYAFASPLVGNEAFAIAANNSFALHRVTNRDDLVPLLPLNVMFNLTGDHNPYLYATAGTDHSFSNNWGSWQNNHIIPIYINCLQDIECPITTIS